MSISADDQPYLNRAEGFLGLGMFKDAEAELAKMSPALAAAPEVLVVRLSIYQEEQRWAAMQAAAHKLAALDPGSFHWIVSLAYATRRAESIEAARAILMDALDRFPTEAIIPYNLACYACQLGDLGVARQFLDIALRLAPEMKPMAREDEDLKPLWDSPEPAG
ncbi:MAG: tetratricopeptide repeat protein [Chthoniobacteraceae bacterium]